MRRTRVPLLVMAGLAVLPATADTAAAKRKAPEITVMSRNLYLGADLGPAIRATSIPAAIDAGGQILDDVDASNFPARAKLLAAEIAKAKPDLLGLQEAALWRSGPADFTGTEATEVRYDFLGSLQSELRKRGARYRVAVVQEEFDQELPADRDGSDATGSAALFGADEDGRLTMRDAILVRKNSRVRVSGAKKGQFEAAFAVKLGGAIDIRVPRGWVSVEARVQRTKKTRAARFRFVNLHLEAFGEPTIRAAQARELFAPGGPYRTRKQLITLGDFNSGSLKDRVGTGSGLGTSGDEEAYNALTQEFGLTKYGARQSCCYPDVFQSAIGAYRFDHTVDHVFAKPKVKQLRTYVTGGDPSVVGAGGVVASDHGGVVSRLRLK